MKRSPRGSSVTRTTREETVARVLQGAGPHTCIPWTGADWKNEHVCPGFTYSKDRALLCYVIPEVIARDLLLFPGFLGTKQLRPPSDQSEEQARKRAEDASLVALSRERAQQEYLRLIQRWTRLVKISGYPETEQRFLPENEDYQIIVLGPFLQAQYGVLSAHADLYKDGRFLVTLGTNPARQAAVDNVPRDSTGQMKPGARVVALARDFQASSQTNLVGAGLPLRGEPPRSRVGAEAPFRVYSQPSGQPASKADLKSQSALDPAARTPTSTGGG